MSVGTTDTWGQSRDQIIADALANLGVIAPGKEATGDVRTHAARALDRIVKALDGEGQFLWRQSRLTLSTTDGTAGYSLDATVFACEDPMDYLAASGTSRTAIWPMTLAEYMQIADRTVEGRPTRYVIEKTITGAGRLLLTAQFYPVPDTTSDTIEYLGCARSKDFTDGSTTPDFPTNFHRGLVYALTAELAPAYKQQNMAAFYERRGSEELAKQIQADNEQQGLQFVPWGGY